MYLLPVWAVASNGRHRLDDLDRVAPVLIDGVGRCPLEDSGGPPGYMEMLEALRDRAHPRHTEMMEWPGPDFDPDDANRAQLEADVAALAKLMTPRRRASAKPKPKQKRRRRSDDERF